MRLEKEKLKNIDIYEVAKSLDIELRNNKGLCFMGHDKLTPSFTISRSKNLWRCHGCGRGGDTIALVSSCLSMNFREACKWLSDEFLIGNLNKEKFKQRSLKLVERKRAVNGTLADPELYTWLVGKCGPVLNELGISYLRDHGISLDCANFFGVVEMVNPKRAYNELVKQWGADRLKKSGLSKNSGSLLWSGYSIIFPLIEESKVKYIQVRLFSGKNKFTGPLGVEKPMFNHEKLKVINPGDTLHICEGIPDALAIEGWGASAVGILGATSFRNEWVDELLPFRLVGIPDGDSGGSSFRENLSRAFRKRSKSISFVTLPPGMDACDVLAKVYNE